MNMTPKEALQLIDLLKKANTDEVDVILCPSFVSLMVAVEAVKGTNIAVGAQDMHYEEKGAYTGEISAQMLTEIGVKYVILGHSERRTYCNETDEMVNKKVLKAIEHNLIPIVCVGESLELREHGIALEYVKLQTKIALKNVPKEVVSTLIMAYEPLWAIGTGQTATSDQAEEVCAAIRQVIQDIYDEEVAEAVRIQYGGSVKASNAKELFSQNNIDGGLIGGASLTEEFLQIVDYNK
jgi:triosephosphate isomerase